MWSRALTMRSCDVRTMSQQEVEGEVEEEPREVCGEEKRL